MLKALKGTAQRIRGSHRLSQILVLLSFLITFAITRAVTHLQRLGTIPNGILPFHHLVPGIFLLIFSGYVGLSFWATDKVRHFMAILFGIGAALTIDEFALWLYLKDVYWERQGRDSIDAIIYAIIILSIIFVISEIHDHKWIKRFLKN
ncbi:MAG: hypothetical protein M1444_02310 [Patescibacteria group bacterium]|nr:hypothetical protein [Patescibacteria group bacterium]